MKNILTYAFLFMFFCSISFAQKQKKQIIISESDYFGADLTQFPPEIREWIMEEAFSVEKMTAAYMLDSKLKANWSEDGNSVLFEASYTIAPNYKGAGSRKIWGTNSKFSGSNSIYAIYGQYAKYHTLRFQWKLYLHNQKLIASDPCFASIIGFAKQLCSEIEYDWSNFSAYHGASVKRTPGKKYCVCEGYTDEVMQRIFQLDCVAAVQKWSSSSHAWNVLELADGRILYFDLTWFDNEHIDEQTGIIEQKDDYNWENITFDEELFKYSNVGYGSNDFEHSKGQMVERITRCDTLETY